jgi:orotidine-5'-phosphate decarboxylase
MSKKKIIIALDFENQNEAMHFASGLDPSLCNLKVGSQLFTSSGPVIIEKLKSLGFDIFLDLKFYDIPNTVYGSVRSAIQMGVWMLNVHASGGTQMMISAKEALRNAKGEVPILIGVTLLTSFSHEDANQLGIKSVDERVMSLANLVKLSGLDGVVCSPREIKKIKKEFGKDFLVISPGIRIPSDESHDQSRIATPLEAARNGADYLVIGRSITRSKNPIATLESIVEELN